MIPENETILERRWPDLLQWLQGAEEGDLLLIERTPAQALHLNGVQLASAYAPVAEARLQAQLLPEGTRRATVYGLGQGNLVRELLRRSELEELHLVLFSRSAAAACMRYVEVFDWLDDPRVTIRVADANTQLETPFGMSPAALRLADPAAWALRDRILAELATPFVRRRLEDQGGRRPENLARTEELRSVDRDVAELFGSETGKTVRVCASGPTLAQHYDELRGTEDTILALDTALIPLLAAGIVPDAVLSIDGNEGSIEAALAPGLEEAAGSVKIPLIYFPTVAHRILESWRGERFAAQASSSFESSTSSVSGPGALFCSGSVLHVTVDLAVRMGARRVLLHGADFATPGGRTHVEGMVWETAGPPIDCGATTRVLDGEGRPVASLPNLVGYLRDLESYIARHADVEFVNTSREGALIQGTAYQETHHAA